jgi:hypothetical protein
MAWRDAHSSDFAKACGDWFDMRDLALQLPFFEMGALSDRLVRLASSSRAQMTFTAPRPVYRHNSESSGCSN